MNAKANREDLESLQASKTNKLDSENQLKALGIMHRQVQSLSVLLIEVSKLLQADQTESAYQRNHKRNYILD